MKLSDDETLDKDWLAVYIYYNPPWEQLLTDLVKPFVNAALDNKWVEQFFFVRYWDQGYHIRLRLYGQKYILKNIVEPNVTSLFNNYLCDKPSLNQTFLNSPSHNLELLHANNSIEFFEYAPETERYGGSTGMSIAHKQFQASSETVFSVIAEHKQLNYKSILSIALSLHLGFAFALNINLRELRQFYLYVCYRWLNKLISPNNQFHIKMNEVRQKSLALLENQFIKQAKNIVPYAKNLWSSFENRFVSLPYWLDSWINSMQKINDDLVKAYLAEKIYCKMTIKPDFPYEFSKENQVLWYIWDSYTHMTNNRLGVSHKDEPYLAYLIYKSLENV